MTTPSTYTTEQIRSEIMRSVSTQLPDGRWVGCRPAGWGGIGLRLRFKAAWLVFTGKCDVLRWDGQP